MDKKIKSESETETNWYENYGHEIKSESETETIWVLKLGGNTASLKYCIHYWKGFYLKSWQ